MKESVSKLWVISMCTARTRKHGSITFDFVSALLDHKLVKHIDTTVCASLCTGKFAIFCSLDLCHGPQHFTHLNKRLLTAVLQLVIQYPELLNSFRVALLPQSAHLM